MRELRIDLAPTPAEHFRLYFYAAVLRVIEGVMRLCDSHEAALAEYPFLAGYQNALATRGLEGCPVDVAYARWREAVLAWEARIDGWLPLRALRDAASLDYDALALLMCVGLVEDDAQFGALFETIQAVPGLRRPSTGLLAALWSDADAFNQRMKLRQLHGLGLLQCINPDAASMDQAHQVPAVLWDALHGHALAPQWMPAWLDYRSPAQLAPFEALILPAGMQQHLRMLPSLLASGEVRALVVRGPQFNGRHTAFGAIARALGRGLLCVQGLRVTSDERWGWIGPLSTLLRAMPVVACELTPGETIEMPTLTAYEGPLGVVLGKQGGVAGSGVDRAITLRLEMPDATARRVHWQSALTQPTDDATLEQISAHFRVTGGAIRRAARLATSYAALSGRSVVTFVEVRQAHRAMNSQMLDTQATHLPELEGRGWNSLVAGADTLRELVHLESRCRNRERLRGAVGEMLGVQLNAGVRALFSGPSGSGKTLAARVLAAALGMDLYRLDLATVVNKYIGETEKNLDQVFTRAEELDVMLLLDEGDALLTNRTSVNTSNDRYANLETNFLLQRLETYDGIVIVTTNAVERIDSAFHRRMDVVIHFRVPDAGERRMIWQLHLPLHHAIDERLLDDVIARCALTGGQIRNAALHASLMALNGAGVVTSKCFEEAVQREYRKLGNVCPLRRHAAVEDATG